MLALIGYALAERLCRDGHNVSGVARRKTPLETLEAQFRNFKGIACDVTDADALLKAVDEARAHFGQSIFLFQMREYIYLKKKAKLILMHFKSILMSIIWLSFAVLRQSLPDMRARNHGHIALMASSCWL